MSTAAKKPEDRKKIIALAWFLSSSGASADNEVALKLVQTVPLLEVVPCPRCSIRPV